MDSENKSYLLKASLFATGLSGIVAEYILSTLATYFLGDSVVQWTLIVSTMLFSMGLGARISQYISKQILVAFILIEFLLSLLVSSSAIIVYVSAAYTIYEGLIIYSLSIMIGLLIGMEIPLVIRLNETFENLKVNIASVLEKDYWGSLLGGVLYAYFFLPKLGMSYTPFLLGFINLLVAFFLFLKVKSELSKTLSKKLLFASLIPTIFIFVGVFFAKKIIFFGDQKKYKDQVVYSEQSKYQKLVITKWKNYFWLYINGNQQFSSMDEFMYHEPLIHPLMQLNQQEKPKKILILGGGDGLAVRELLKYSDIEKIKLIDLDPAMTRLGKFYPMLKELNQESLSNQKVSIFNTDGMVYLSKDNDIYDLIIIDLPDPKNITLNRLYTKSFYDLCYIHLRRNGTIITQAGSPYYASKAYLCIEKTMAAAGFNTAKLHNQVLTLGEWGWIAGIKNKTIDLKKRLRTIKFDDQINTKWINEEAMLLMTSFGKQIYRPDMVDTDIEINQIQNPVLYQYYLKGDWGLY